MPPARTTVRPPSHHHYAAVLSPPQSNADSNSSYGRQQHAAACHAGRSPPPATVAPPPPRLPRRRLAPTPSSNKTVVATTGRSSCGHPVGPVAGVLPGVRRCRPTDILLSLSSTLSDKSTRVDQKEAANEAVLLAHLQLQKEELLSSWTNCFVGPWDPSQGLHNPDEKVKLWLFLPGQHPSIVEKARSAVARLRVLASRLWVAPSDSEEVAAVLSQALRNCIERSLKGLSYVQFGDAFSKYHPYTQNEELFRYYLRRLKQN